MRISSAGFSAPIFALALVSFLPEQAQAECSNTAYVADDYNGGAGDDIILCDTSDLALGDAVITDADNVNGNVGKDQITIDNGFTVKVGINGGLDDDDLNLNAGSILNNGVNVLMGDGDDDVVLNGGVNAQVDYSGVVFDGGNQVANDKFFAFNGYVGKVGSVVNFEQLQLNLNSTLGLTQDLTFTNLVQVDAGSTLQFLDPALDLVTANLNNQGTVEAFGGGAGIFTITGVFTNDGLFDMSDGAAGDKLTIQGAGDYATNTAGGTIRLDVFIGGTGSPADNILIQGAVIDNFASGIEVIPTGFDPQFTGTGPGNGIALISVPGGGTDAADFFLAGGPINAGAFVYDLKLETDFIWYLQSTRLVDIVQAFPGMITAAQQQGELAQGTLHQRMGDLRHEEDKHPNKNAFQVWMRGFGGHSDVDNDTGRFDFRGATTDFAGGFDSTTFGGQGGADYGFADLFTGQDRLHVGVMGYYGHTDVDFGVLPVDGNIDGYGGGVYATYIHPNFYVDTSVLAGALDFSTTDNARGRTEKYDGETIGASIETGVPIALGQFMIEPQLQLTYREVSFDRFENGDGAQISVDDGESLKGRAGARFAVNLNPAEGLQVTPYVTASVVQEFLGDNTVDADNVRLHSDVEGTSFDGALGVSASFGNAVSLFAETGGALGEDVDSYRGNLGIRVSW